jgi:hypothetical protein
VSGTRGIVVVMPSHGVQQRESVAPLNWSGQLMKWDVAQVVYWWSCKSWWNINVFNMLTVQTTSLKTETRMLASRFAEVVTSHVFNHAQQSETNLTKYGTQLPAEYGTQLLA